MTSDLNKRTHSTRISQSTASALATAFTSNTLYLICFPRCFVLYLLSVRKMSCKQNKSDVSVVVSCFLFKRIKDKLMLIHSVTSDYSQYLFRSCFQFSHILYSEGLSKC